MGSPEWPVHICAESDSVPPPLDGYGCSPRQIDDEMDEEGTISGAVCRSAGWLVTWWSVVSGHSSVTLGRTFGARMDWGFEDNVQQDGLDRTGKSKAAEEELLLRFHRAMRTNCDFDQVGRREATQQQVAAAIGGRRYLYD